MPYGKPNRPPLSWAPPEPVPTAAIAHGRAEDIVRVLHGRYRDPCLYGSVARGEAGPGSDIDIAASAEPGLAAEWDRLLSDELSGLLGIPVDLCRWDSMCPEHRATAERDAIPLGPAR